MTTAQRRRSRLAAPWLVGLVGLAALVGAGCGSGGDTGAPTPDTARSSPGRSTGSAPGGGSTTAAEEVGGWPDLSVSCEPGSLETRTYVLCLPGDQQDLHLVVALHGRGSSAEEMRAVTGLDTLVGGQQIAVVYPDAVGGRWGDDSYADPERPTGREDVDFLVELVTHLRTDPRINDATVGLVGFSNGASMALRYAAERPTDVAAVVSVAGQLPRDPSIRPRGPVSLLEIYGTADPIRSYEHGIADPPDRRPGDSTPTLSTIDTVDAFIDAGLPLEGYTEAPPSSPGPDDPTSVRSERWELAAGQTVILHTVDGGGHTWPSSNGTFTTGLDVGVVSQQLDASAQAIAFIEAYAPDWTT